MVNLNDLILEPKTFGDKLASYANDDTTLVNQFINDYKGTDQPFNSIIGEYVDAQAPIYYHDIFALCEPLNDDINSAIEEGRTEGYVDIFDIIRAGAFYYLDTLMFNNVGVIIQNYAIQVLKDNKVTEIDIDDFYNTLFDLEGLEISFNGIKRSVEKLIK